MIVLLRFLITGTLMAGISHLLPAQELHVCKHWESAQGFGENFRTGIATDNYQASDNFDVHYYQLNWEVDPSIRYISGRVGVYFEITTGTETISLDLHNDLTVLSVTSNGQILTFDHNNHALALTLPGARAAGVKDSVFITYQGIPPVTGFNAFQRTTQGASVPILFTLSEPFGSRDWWPCKNGLDDKADSIDVFIKHPAGYNGHTYRATSNGLRQSERQTANGDSTIVHWKHRYPIASYLVAMAITNYSVFGDYYDVAGDQILMETYCFPQSTSTFANGADLAMNMMNFFSQKFGKYPFLEEKYGHTQFTWSGGMEHQTNSFMVNMDRTLVAHELAHQWFGNKITCGSWEDIWLNEGFASYLTSLYLESIDPPATVLGRRKNEISFITSQAGGSVKPSDPTNPSTIFNSRLSYFKGAHLLFMLQWILGDEDFFGGVNQYLNDPALAYGFATTSQLQQHLEAASGKDLGYFFDQWFEGEGHPSYHLEWRPVGNNVQFRLSQTSSMPSSVAFFRLPVPLLFTGANPGEERLVVVDNTSNYQFFNESLGFEAVAVAIDPDAWLISRNNTSNLTDLPLPVKFHEIKAICENDIAVISWKVSDEVSVSHYAVQQLHGNQWKDLGRTVSANSPEPYEYRLAVKETGYYRVVQYDLTGGEAISPVVSASCSSGHPDLVIAPNPAGQELKLSFENLPSETLQIRIVDHTGRTLFKESADPSKTSVTIDISHLPAGVYQVIAESTISGFRINRSIVRQ